MRMDDRSLRVLPPLLRDKHYSTPSAFTPESLLREARRQKDVPNTPVRDICILDPDGDILRHLRAEARARPVAAWACYHSTMDRFDDGGREYGIVGCAVGAPYALLVAEQLFASGCRPRLSITSSGQPDDCITAVNSVRRLISWPGFRAITEGLDSSEV